MKKILGLTLGLVLLSSVAYAWGGKNVAEDKPFSANIERHFAGERKGRPEITAEKKAESITRPMPQKWCTQEERQLGYDNWETTDDHGMLIYGKAKDQQGTEYYLVKNSWGKAGKYEGIWYASKAFVRYKTMNIVVHKDALPKDIKKKLGLK